MHKLRWALKPMILLFVAFMVGLTTLPAEAAPIQEVQIQVVPQTFTASPEAVAQEVVQDEFLVSYLVTWPTDGQELTDCFGCRGGSHMGIDISYGGINGTPVYAVAAGCAVQSGYDGSYGEAITLYHPYFGIETKYGHMIDGSRQIQVGQCVDVGDIIGLVGSTGGSTGPHLHFEVHVGGIPVDPLPWLWEFAH